MAVPVLLTWLVLASALFALGGICWLGFATARIGRAKAQAAADKPKQAGCPRPNRRQDACAPGELQGVGYAFGQGMLPWEKESARRHWVVFATGILFHLGILAGLLLVFWLVAVGPAPRPIVPTLATLLLLSAFGGIGLLARRLFLASLRKLSCPDDYAANLALDGFLILAFLATLDGAWESPLLLLSALILLYLPVGKIRHCFFFFYTRVLFGRFFGRRGVLPHRAPL